MIEGLKLRVTSQELNKHLRSRAAYHRARAEEKEGEVPAIKESMARLKEHRSGSPSSVSMMTKSSNYNLDPDDPVRELEKDIREHRNKALVFDYFAEHLFDEEYTLREDDLVRIEIVRR